MKRDPYRDRAEKDRKELLAAKTADSQANQEEATSRLELHGKKREEKKSSKKPFPLIGLLLASFVLLPLTVVLVSIFFFSNNDSGLTNATLENSNEFQIEKNRETALSDKAEPVLAGVSNDEEAEEEVSAAEEPAEEVQEEPAEPADTPEEQPVEEPVEQPVEEEEVQEEIETEQSSGSTHTVQASETLYRISVNYGLGPDGVEQLRQLNNLGDNEIYVGQVLQLP
ncbi:LysM peptidoglycan-binding domain-containing protein [Jeotgalibacillus haloalkalitolerans]|uniref:LysM peptidoglycan-binding domain-containing protein n=1 Tax=Jeotgalibacillus haloalkalitolerans TaxID=3104292 RepID=A0ABU5KLM7_9BACL|nr:LysM peptidoglycan-binding domain-containing protein [Jeotgalibacillus sp. HH7-29]MDZ5712037.1 LysM peptidoglycan-binding domain-containing protein [Jeotgalibacillus sp. HH7-29]